MTKGSRAGDDEGARDGKWGERGWGGKGREREEEGEGEGGGGGGGQGLAGLNSREMNVG